MNVQVPHPQEGNKHKIRIDARVPRNIPDIATIIDGVKNALGTLFSDCSEFLGASDDGDDVVLSYTVDPTKLDSGVLTERVTQAKLLTVPNQRRRIPVKVLPLV